MPTAGEIISKIEEVAPLSLQESYDNAGLQIGNAAAEAKGALLCIDVTEDIVDEAVAKGCNLIISHHPLLFKGLKRISGRNEIERIVIKAIKNDIAIYSAHTNMDNASEGVSMEIADRIGLENRRVLDAQHGRLLKLVVFVPVADAAKVREAVCAAGAGKIGNYDCCSYATEGTGTFRALEGANPYVGDMNELHFEPETRLEFILPDRNKSSVLKAMIAAHPYEEPAFDIIRLECDSKYEGAGLVGEITPTPVREFLEMLKEKFNARGIRYSGGKTSEIRTVALCGGSGAFLIPNAIASGADIYISGDIKYHDFTTFGNDIIIADIGHYESEQYTKQIFNRIICKNFPNFATYYPDKEKNPINYL